MPADEQVADADWIEEAAKCGWAVLMRDKRIRYLEVEIAAVTEHKARCFVITRGDLGSADMAQLLARTSTQYRQTGSRSYIHSCGDRQARPITILARRARCMPDRASRGGDAA